MLQIAKGKQKVKRVQMHKLFFGKVDCFGGFQT
jgi:hypothetical protein